MGIALGYKAMAALRTTSRRSAAFWVSSHEPWLQPSKYGLIPLDSLGISAEDKFSQEEFVQGTAAFEMLDRIFRGGGGSLQFSALYDNLDLLLCMALGYEKIRQDASYESPVFERDGQGRTPDSNRSLVGTCASTTCVTGSSFFSTANVGDWVRIEDAGGTCNTLDQVRRITGYNSATSVNITPAWNANGIGVTPSASANRYVRTGRIFTHTIEPSNNLNAEKPSEIVTTGSNWATAETSAGRYLSRSALLIVWNGQAYMAFDPIMVKSLTLKFDPAGVKISAEVVARYVDFSNEERSPNYANWGWNPSVDNSAVSIYIKERVLFSDLYFRLAAFSTGTPLDSSNNIGVRSLELSIDNSLETGLQTLSSGNYQEEPVRGGNRRVSGSFDIPRWTDASIHSTLTDWVSNSTELMGAVVGTGSLLGGSLYHALKFWLRRVRLLKDDSANLSGPSPLQRKFPFQVLNPTASMGSPNGMPTPNLSTGAEIIVQSVNQNPFNALMSQDWETTELAS